MYKDNKLGGKMLSMKDANKTYVAKVYWVAREQWVCGWKEGDPRIRGSRVSGIIGLRMKK